MASRSVIILCAIVISVVIWHSTPVATYKILMLPLSGKSHLFSALAIAEGLADRDHDITLVVSRHMQFDVPEAKAGQPQRIFVERYEDGLGNMEAMYDDIALRTMEGKSNQRDQISFIVSL